MVFYVISLVEDIFFLNFLINEIHLDTNDKLIHMSLLPTRARH